MEIDRSLRSRERTQKERTKINNDFFARKREALRLDEERSCTVDIVVVFVYEEKT